MRQPVCDPARFASLLFLFQLIYQFDGGQEAHTKPVVLYSLNANRSSKMSLAGSRSANKDYVLSIFDELATV